jgi:regulatory protein
MDNSEVVQKAALRLLNFKPRSESELRQRLARKKLPAEAIESVIVRLQKEGMLDDEKFARLYALSRIQSQAFGRGQIRRELTHRGVSSSLVSKAMRSIEDFDEFEAAKNLAVRRSEHMKGLAPDAKKRRLHGLLFRRGFPGDVIAKVLREVLVSRNEGLSEDE